MNGNWQYPWSVQLNGNHPGDYIQAWQHVHDIFAQAGATNVTWVWCPNISDPGTVPMAALYPGDNYVDWTCFDGYNKEDAWVDFNTVFTGSGINWLLNSYQEVLTVAPNKPVMIGETASIEAGDGGAKKAAWITDAFLTQLPTNFPKIKAVVWFNYLYGTQDFRAESTQPSLDAFAAAIGSNYYAANDFANYDISPIRPLP
jgi:mannan endo-1,4-beta-mannosidase